MQGKTRERVPAEVFAPCVYIKDELEARGWTEDQLFERIPHPMDRLAVMLITHVANKNLIMDPRTANALGAAFDVSPQFFLNLDAAWRGVKPLEAVMMDQKPGPNTENILAGEKHYRPVDADLRDTISTQAAQIEALSEMIRRMIEHGERCNWFADRLDYELVEEARALAFVGKK